MGLWRLFNRILTNFESFLAKNPLFFTKFASYIFASYVFKLASYANSTVCLCSIREGTFFKLRHFGVPKTPHPPLSSNQWKKVSQNYKIPENEWNFQFFGAITVQNHRTSLNSLWPAFFSNFLNKRSLERYPRWQPRISLLGARKPPKLYLLGLERRNLG